MKGSHDVALHDAFSKYFNGTDVPFRFAHFGKDWTSKEAADETIKQNVLMYLEEKKGVDFEQLLSKRKDGRAKTKEERKADLLEARRILTDPEGLNSDEVFVKEMGLSGAIASEYYRRKGKKNSSHDLALYEAFKEDFREAGIPFRFVHFGRDWSTNPAADETIRQCAFMYLEEREENPIDLERLLSNEKKNGQPKSAEERTRDLLKARGIIADEKELNNDAVFRRQMGADGAIVSPYYRRKGQDKSNHATALYEAFRESFRGTGVPFRFVHIGRDWSNKDAADETISQCAFMYLEERKENSIDLEQLLSKNEKDGREKDEKKRRDDLLAARGIIADRLELNNNAVFCDKMGCGGVIGTSHYRRKGEKNSNHETALYEAFKRPFNEANVPFRFVHIGRDFTTKDAADETIRQCAFMYLAERSENPIDLEYLLSDKEKDGTRKEEKKRRDDLLAARKIIADKNELNSDVVFLGQMGCGGAVATPYYRKEKAKYSNHETALYEAFRGCFEGSGVPFRFVHIGRDWTTKDAADETIKQCAFMYLAERADNPIDLEQLLSETKKDGTKKANAEHLLDLFMVRGILTDREQLNNTDVFFNKMKCGRAVQKGYYLKKGYVRESHEIALYDAFKHYFKGKNISFRIVHFGRDWTTKEAADETIRECAFMYLEEREVPVDLEYLLSKNKRNGKKKEKKERKDDLLTAHGIITSKDELNNDAIFCKRMGCASAIATDYYRKKGQKRSSRHTALYEVFKDYFKGTEVSLRLEDFIKSKRYMPGYYGREQVENELQARKEAGGKSDFWSLAESDVPEDMELLDAAMHFMVPLEDIEKIDEQRREEAVECAVNPVTETWQAVSNDAGSVKAYLIILKQGMEKWIENLKAKGERTLSQEMKRDGINGILENTDKDRFSGRPIAELLGLESPRVIASDWEKREIGFQNKDVERDPFQASAVKLTLAKETKTMLVQGGAGSGKSTLGAEIIYQLAKQGKKILVVCTTHEAVDNMMIKLDREGLPVQRAYNGILPDGIENTQVIEKVHPGMRKYWMQDRRDGKYNEEGYAESNKRKRDFIGAEIIGMVSDSIFSIPEFRGKEFDAVVIDEAGKSNAFDTLLPAVLAKEKVVFIGDPEQLRPFMDPDEQKGQEAGFIDALRYSYMEKLMNKGYNQVFMARNYRNHPILAMLLSRTIYRDLMEPKMWRMLEEDTLKICDIPLVNPGMPNEMQGDEPDPQLSGKIIKGYSNEYEAQAVVSEYKRALAAGYRMEEISIVSGYRRQVDLIREKMRGYFSEKMGEGLSPRARVFLDRNIRTIDGYQGKENKVVIVSFVRSNPDPQKVGHMGDFNRWNVMVSRMIDRLVLVGDMGTLREAKLTKQDRIFSEFWRTVEEILDKVEKLKRHEKAFGLYTIREIIQSKDGRLLKNKNSALPIVDIGLLGDLRLELQGADIADIEEIGLLDEMIEFLEQAHEKALRLKIKGKGMDWELREEDYFIVDDEAGRIAERYDRFLEYNEEKSQLILKWLKDDSDGPLFLNLIMAVPPEERKAKDKRDPKQEVSPLERSL